MNRLNTRPRIDLFVHLYCILANVMLFAELCGRGSSPFDISDNRFNVRQKLLDFLPLRLHRLRELCVFGMCSLEVVIQRRFRFLKIRYQMCLI